MRRTNLRRLEALEKEERVRQQKELRALEIALMYIWIIVLGYYLGDLKSDPWEALARALKYASADIMRKEEENATSEDFYERYYDAYRRLFAKVDLDFDRTSSRVLFEAFVKMVNELPERWLNWLKPNLEYSQVEIAPGSNLPRHLSRHNFFWIF